MSLSKIASDIKRTFRLVLSIRKNPKVGAELKNSAIFRLITRVIPHKFLRHYIYPLLAGRGSSAYDAKQFFDSYYQSAANGELSDGTTVSPDYDPLLVRYHYDVTETNLIESLVRYPLPRNLRVLDVGPGAGHWIDFYLEVFRATHLTGAEISDIAAQGLKEKYSGEQRVRIIRTDVSDPNFDLCEHFDLINAIGVVFHIVDDAEWKQALKNFARHLKPDGHLIVGGQFGWITRNIQFHSADEYNSWDELMDRRDNLRLVNKRIRSYRYWKQAASDAGLQIAGFHKTNQAGYFYTPENNILILTHKDPQASLSLEQIELHSRTVSRSDRSS